MAGEETILWRRLDRPGHEAARLSRKGEDWNLAGTAVFLYEGGRFVAELEVNAAGFITLYPEFCRVEAAGR